MIPGNFGDILGMIPGNFGDILGMIPGNFGDILGMIPDHCMYGHFDFQGHSRYDLGHSGTFR
jgi:hypothetical protein